MIKNRRIQELIKVMEKNKFSAAYVSRETNVSYAQINRYIKDQSVPSGLLIIKALDRFITENK